jgi:hypothetical protein
LSDGELEGQRQPPLPRVRFRVPRRVVAFTLGLVLAVNAGGALAAALTGSGFTSPVKLVAQEFGSVFRSTSTKLSAAQAVYSSCPQGTTGPTGCGTPGPTTTVKATAKKKPLKCKKNQVKRTKKVHGKKVTLCVKKKRHVKAVAKHRLPSFTG